MRHAPPLIPSNCSPQQHLIHCHPVLVAGRRMQSAPRCLVPLLAAAAAVVLILPSCARAKVVTNADPATGGLELPLYTRNFVLTCNNTGAEMDHWEFNGYELQKDDQSKLGMHVAADDISRLTIGNTRKQHEGNYTCVFRNEERGLILVKAKPEAVLESENFVPGTSSLNLVEGASLRLLCKSKSNDSVNVRWQWQPEDLSDEAEEVTSDPVFNLFQSTAPTGSSVAILNILSVKYSDRAFYICRVDNGIAASEVTILIRVKDKLAALWPFLAIVGEVLILCTVIFIYEKRKSKSGELEDDAPTITSKPSSPAKGAPEGRQRK